jgi:hypothetical protein
MTTPTQRPTFLQAITIAGAGLLIALFGCLGAIAGIGGPTTTTLTEVGIAGFVLGFLIFVVGGVLLLIVVIRPFFSGRSSSAAPQPAAPPAAPTAAPPDTPAPPPGD